MAAGIPRAAVDGPPLPPEPSGRLLVVDDDPAQVRLLEAMPASDGYGLASAADAATARPFDAPVRNVVLEPEG